MLLGVWLGLRRIFCRLRFQDPQLGVWHNAFRHNGKELENKEFTDGTGLEEYDYGLRFQDPQLGVWHNADPLADRSLRWSPYSYVYDNPVSFIDPNGGYAAKIAQIVNYSFGPSTMFDDDEGGGGGGGGSGAGGGGSYGGSGMSIGNGNYLSPSGQLMDYNEALNYATQNYSYSMSTYTGSQAQQFFIGMQIAMYGQSNNLVASTVYNYSAVNSNSAFETDNYHGYVSNTSEGQYVYMGTSTKISVVDIDDGSGSDTNSEGMSGWEIAGQINDYLSLTIGAFGNGTINKGFVAASALSGQLGGGLSDGTLNALADIGNFSKYGKIASDYGPLVGLVIGGVKTYYASQSEGYFGPNTQATAVATVAGVVGGWSGAEIGAAIGGGIGFLFGGAGAVPGAIIGGFIGGVIGSWGGEKAAEELW